MVVSLPAGTEEIIFSLVAIILNYLIVITAGVGEIASFTIAWRFISIIFLPCMAIGIATITVSGVAYGARNWKNFNETIKYSTLLSLIITLILSAIFLIFAGPICSIFNFSANNSALVERSAEILRFLVFYNCMIPFGATAAYVYQGVGSGFKSLGLTILRELILSMACAYIMGITLAMGVFGVYLGAIIGMNIGSFIGFICIWIFNLKFKRRLKMIVNHKDVKSVISKSNLPIAGFTVNPYVGCAHACKYCYADFMKRFTGHKEQWGSFVDVKHWQEIKILKNTQVKQL